MSWTLFVEGPDDRVFVRWLLDHLKITDVFVDTIGGDVSRLAAIAPRIRRNRNQRRQVAVLLDANSSVERRRRELREAIARLNLPIERSFLIPNDADDGNLETLLEQMAPSAHQAVYRCFDEYEACLRQADPAYATPDRKARVYAYCEAVGASTRGRDRNYDDPTHWNPNAPALEPLRRFLRGLVK